MKFVISLTDSASMSSLLYCILEKIQVMKISNILLLLLLNSVFIHAQNQAPEIIQIEKTAVSATSASYELWITDTDDTDLDLDVKLVWSSTIDSAWQFFPVESLAGDVGTVMNDGTTKTIEVFIHPDSVQHSADIQPVFLLSDGNSADIQGIVDQVDISNLESLMNFIEGPRHELTGAAHYNAVRDSFRSICSNPDNIYLQEQEFPIYTESGYNILGWQNSFYENDTVYFIGAHYDTVLESPGADDNGSAVAGVMEALRILSQWPMKKRISYAFWDKEELGLIGSINYVTNGALPSDVYPAGYFNFEMIGYYSDEINSQTLPVGFDLLFPDAANAVVANDYRGDFLTNVANEFSSPLMDHFEDAASIYVPSLSVISLATPGNGEITQDLRRSDHAAFWDAGFQALMLTDGANFRNPYYHTANDTVGTLDFQFMTDVVKATIGAICELTEPLNQDYKFASECFSCMLTSLDETSNAGDTYSLNVFPNPNSGRFSLEYNSAENGYARILDIKGNLLFEEILENSGSKILDASNLENGYYQLLIYNVENEIVESSKIVIIHNE